MIGTHVLTEQAKKIVELKSERSGTLLHRFEQAWTVPVHRTQSDTESGTHCLLSSPIQNFELYFAK